MELLMQIISYIEDLRHLQDLLIVSKIFRSIVEPVLYRVIKIGGVRGLDLPPSKLGALYRTLEIPRIAGLVTVLKVDLNKWQHCFQCSRQLSRGVIARSVSLYVAISAACSCDTLDREFGRVVVNLKNLQALSFSCYLTHRKGDHQHSWFATLQERELKELEIWCRFSCEQILFVKPKTSP
ncbi:hypothetical protein FRB91_003472 [Serendipita sp. 411]|nr:hypothetical protein FRC19_006189 [Serendipita sp. 401]KAG8843292.1 hypothetical protein FRB91_003472 [Serendipita sp. 411]